jgi:hypothetical protein
VSRTLLMSAVCVMVLAVGCSAQSPAHPSDKKPDGAKAKSLDDLTRDVLGEADAALKAKPNHLDALWKKASAEFHLKDYKASRMAVEAGLKKNSDDPRFHFLSAALYRVEGDSKTFEDEEDWFLKRDKSYTMALSRLQVLDKKEVREKFHDAYQAAWLIAEGHATPETKTAIDRDLDKGAVAVLSTAWSPWHTDEQNERLQDALVAVGKVAKPMLEGGYETLRKSGGLLEDSHNAFVRKSIDLAGDLGLRSDEPGVKEMLDANLKEMKARGARYAKEIKEIDRQMAWMKETYHKIKD